jgi:hypothetical protein
MTVLLPLLLLLLLFADGGDVILFYTKTNQHYLCQHKHRSFLFIAISLSAISKNFQFTYQTLPPAGY